jgi:tetratricopeptide (TPR) repeat protein
MTRKALLTTAALAASTQATPSRLQAAAVSDGGSASPEALQRLNAAIAALKMQAVLPILRHAAAEVQADRHKEGGDLALQALEIDEKCSIAWHILAICREKAGDYTSSLACYETALNLDPDEVELANDLGRLAYAMGMKEEAEALFANYAQRKPDSFDGINNLACCQRDRMRFDEAVETLRPALYKAPDNAMLWNTLGTVMAEQGEMDQAVLFFDEALRFKADFAKARYNRANARLALGDTLGALGDCKEAIAGTVLESELAMMRIAQSTMLMCNGQLGEGFDVYENRLNAHYADATHFLVDGEKAHRLQPGMDLAGKHLLLFGEQGLGDEVLFASLLPDIIEALGPDGKLSLAIERRLIPLFKRSFPDIEIGEHLTAKVDHHTVRFVRWVEDWETIDLWAPIASPLRIFRRELADFPDRRAFLAPDPARVAHWRGVLAGLGDGLKAGLVWKSLKVESARFRHFSPFEQWRPVLETPGVTFVNLQYGECAAELAEAKAKLGVEIWNPPGVNLKDDLDEVAALTSALDLTLGPANATSNIAAACGAPVWLVSTPGAWPRLGTLRYPWYPSVRVFLPPAYNNWGPVMEEMAIALRAEVATR